MVIWLWDSKFFLHNYIYSWAQTLWLSCQEIILISENKRHHMHCHRGYLICLAVVSGVILCTTLGVVVWLLVLKRSKRRKKACKLSNPAALALVPPSWKIFKCVELRSIKRISVKETVFLGMLKQVAHYIYRASTPGCTTFLREVEV